MGRVIDYAWNRPSVASLKAAGAIAVCRYLSYDTTGKTLSRTEADGLRGGGMDIVSNWEQAGSWTEYSGGQAAGRRHATEANRQHLACGGPPGRPIYFSTDWPVTAAQMATVAEYYRGAAAVIGLDRTGAYGGYPVIKYLFDAGVITYGWQTYAWSGGVWDPRAQLRQIQNGVLVGGVDCDLDESRAADFGQWGAAPPLAPPAPKEAAMGKLILCHWSEDPSVHWAGDGTFRYRVTDLGATKWFIGVAAGITSDQVPDYAIWRGTEVSLGPILITPELGTVPDQLAVLGAAIAAIAAPDPGAVAAALFAMLQGSGALHVDVDDERVKADLREVLASARASFGPSA